MDKKLRAEMAKRHNATGLYRRLPFQYTYKSRLPRKKGLVKRCMLRILKKVQFKKKNQVEKRSKEPNTRPSTPERETMSESEADAMPVEAKPEESEAEANSEESEAEANPEESEANPEESEAEANPEESEAEANPEESEAKPVESEESKPGGLKSILKKVEPMQEEEQEPEPEEESEQDQELEPISAPRKPFPNLRGIEFLRKSRWSLEYDCE